MKVAGRRAGASAVVATVLLLLAGCAGGSDGRADGNQGEERSAATAHADPNGVMDMTPNRAMHVATRAMGRLKDATYRGTVAFAFPTGDQQVRIDVTTIRGGPCEMRVSSRALGPFVIRVVDHSVYLHAGDRVLTDGFGLPDEAVARAGGKWASIPLSSGLTAGCSIEAVSDVESITRNGCVPYAVEPVRGIPTRAFQCWGGYHGPGTGAAAVMYVATEGSPLILRTVGRNAVGPCDVSMVRWNTRPTIEAPPPARVIGSGEYA